MKIVATTPLPAVDRPNADRWNAARSRQKLEIDDRVHTTTKRDSYITVKDHKPQFMNNPKFRLINPTKSELGMVSKQMLEQIIIGVKNETQLTQWKNSDAVISWFNQLKNKEKLLFIQFDVVDFYGSISQVLVENSLTFAARHTKVSNEEKETILQAANSFLFSDNQEWIKKEGGTFDVTMGGYHGAEICDLVGLFLLSQLVDIIPSPHIGLYRDDGLAVSRAIGVFKKVGFKINTLVFPSTWHVRSHHKKFQP